MREEDALTEAERESAQSLARFKPAAARLDVSHIGFEAQRRRANRQVWRWRGIAAALAVGLILSWIWRPQATVRERVVYVRVSVPASAPDARSVPLATSGVEPPAGLRVGDEYLAVRDRILAFGVEALRPHEPSVRHVRPLLIPDASPLPEPATLAGGGL